MRLLFFSFFCYLYCACLFVVRGVLFVGVCGALFVVRLLFVVRCVLLVACCMLLLGFVCSLFMCAVCFFVVWLLLFAVVVCGLLLFVWFVVVC